MSDIGYNVQRSAQAALGLTPPMAGGMLPIFDVAPADTVPTPPQLPISNRESGPAPDSQPNPKRIGGGTGQQRGNYDGGTGVVLGGPLYLPQYTPLSDVAFADYDMVHRTVHNLFHALPPTASAVPRPDWNPFATLANWPMKAASALKTTVFGGPQTPRPSGNP